MINTPHPSHPFRFWLPFIALISLAPPLLAFESQLEEISRSIARSLEEGGKSRVAVVDFTDIQGKPSQLGRFLAEELSVALVSAADGFEVVDRLHLQTLIGEHELSRAGVFARETTEKLRDLVGIDALVTGRLTPSSTRIRVSVKVLDTETASLLGAASASLDRDGFIDELLAGTEREVGPAPSTAPTLRPRTPAAPQPSVPAMPPPTAHVPAAPPVAAPPPDHSPTPAAPPFPSADSEPPVEVPAQPSPSAPPSAPPAPPPSALAVSEPPAPNALPAREPVLAPVTISVRELRVLESSVQVRLSVRNNTASVLEWGESGGSQLSDGQDNALVCSKCPKGVGGDAVLVAARTQAEVELFFIHDPKAAALKERDAFSFFFNAKRAKAATFEGPFTLSLNYEYRGSGKQEPRESSVVFADLPGE